MDVALQNPLPVEIVITKISLVVEQTTTDGQSPEIETLEEVVLAPKEFRTVSTNLPTMTCSCTDSATAQVSVAVTARHASTLRISHLTYSFLSVLPMRESLARKGKRLDTTPAQRQTPTYAPDIVLSVEVGGDAPRLDVTWAPEDVRSRGYAYEDEQAPMRFDLVRGELLATGLTFTNVGTKPIAELWILRPANSGIVAVGNLDGMFKVSKYLPVANLAAIKWWRMCRSLLQVTALHRRSRNESPLTAYLRRLSCNLGRRALCRSSCHPQKSALSTSVLLPSFAR